MVKIVAHCVFRSRVNSVGIYGAFLKKFASLLLMEITCKHPSKILVTLYCLPDVVRYWLPLDMGVKYR